MAVFKLQCFNELSHFFPISFPYMFWRPLTSWLLPDNFPILPPFPNAHMHYLSFRLSNLNLLPQIVKNLVGNLGLLAILVLLQIWEFMFMSISIVSRLCFTKVGVRANSYLLKVMLDVCIWKLQPSTDACSLGKSLLNHSFILQKKLLSINVSTQQTLL